jgi:hypothetical protein
MIVEVVGDIKYIFELNGTMRGNLSWFDIVNHVTGSWADVRELLLLE